MTKSYAHWAFLAAEDNPLATSSTASARTGASIRVHLLRKTWPTLLSI